MDISLPPAMEKFVERQLGNGLYQTPSEVIQAGLSRLMQDPKAQVPSVPDTLEELEAMLMESAASLDAGRGVNIADLEKRLREGIERLDHGEGIDGRESLRRMRQRIAEATANG